MIVSQSSNHLPTVGRVEARSAGRFADEVRADYGRGRRRHRYRRRVRHMERPQWQAEARADMDDR